MLSPLGCSPAVFLKLWLTPRIQCSVPHPSPWQLWAGTGDTPVSATLTFQGLEEKFFTASKSSFTGVWTKGHGVGRAGSRQGKATSGSHFHTKLLFQLTPFNLQHKRCSLHLFLPWLFNRSLWHSFKTHQSSLFIYADEHYVLLQKYLFSALGLFYFPIVKMKDWLNNLSSACQVFPFFCKSSSSDSHH